MGDRERSLEEAAILTTDASVLRRARDFIDRLCTNQVTQTYLKECKRLYERPNYNGKRSSQTAATKRTTQPSLWIVNLEPGTIPESEEDDLTASERKARRLVKDEIGSELDYFHWPSKPKMADVLQLGDRIIEVVRENEEEIFVYPPSLDGFCEWLSGGEQRGSGVMCSI